MCLNCCKDYDKYGQKYDIKCECTEGHKLELSLIDPYEDFTRNISAKCNECSKTNLINNDGHLFYCSPCKYVLCKSCDILLNGIVLKPIC